MAKKRGILVKSEEYAKANEILNKKEITTWSTLSQLHFNLISALPSAIVGGAIVWLIMSQL